MRTLIMLIASVIVSTHLHASEASQDKLRGMLVDEIKLVHALAQRPAVIQATREHNAIRLSLELIKQRDSEWKASDDNSEFKQSMINNPSSKELQSLVDDNKQTYGEAFLTGNQGANIAVYPLTSDYWQGDEDKWMKAFNQGEGVVYVGNMEWDDSSKSQSAQISAPVIDNNGKTIGVLVVSVKLSHVLAQQLKTLLNFSE